MAVLCLIVLPHILGGGIHFFFQFPGGYPQHTAADGRKLHQTVGGGYTYIVVVTDLRHQGFDVSIAGLGFLGEHHLDQLIQEDIFQSSLLISNNSGSSSIPF